MRTPEYPRSFGDFTILYILPPAAAAGFGIIDAVIIRVEAAGCLLDRWGGGGGGGCCVSQCRDRRLITHGTERVNIGGGRRRRRRKIRRNLSLRPSARPRVSITNCVFLFIIASCRYKQPAIQPQSCPLILPILIWIIRAAISGEPRWGFFSSAIDQAKPEKRFPKGLRERGRKEGRKRAVRSTKGRKPRLMAGSRVMEKRLSCVSHVLFHLCVAISVFFVEPLLGNQKSPLFSLSKSNKPLTARREKGGRKSGGGGGGDYEDRRPPTRWKWTLLSTLKFTHFCVFSKSKTLTIVPLTIKEPLHKISKYENSSYLVKHIPTKQGASSASDPPTLKQWDHLTTGRERKEEKE